jgi:HTH-type transcriptional regulator/antitoxin HigA
MASSIRFEPDYAVAPGASLRATLEKLGLTQAKLAARTGLSMKHVNQVIQGAAPITPDTALLLEMATAVSARYWNALEAVYRERVARTQSRARLAEDADWLRELPIKELIIRGYLAANVDAATQVEQVCRFFGIADRQRWRQVWLAPLASFRQSPSFIADAGAVATWLRLGELEAATIDTGPYDAKRFRQALVDIRGLTVQEPETALKCLRTACAEAGVAVVFLPDIGRTRTSGAARWLTPKKALIQLSDRYKADDRFWFSFFHEAGHVLLHSKKETFVSGREGGNTSEEEEDEADKFAAAQLIPRRDAPRLAQLRTDRDVVDLADELGIAPGIVVGRLHNDGLWEWSRGNRLKQTISFEHLGLSPRQART